MTTVWKCNGRLMVCRCLYTSTTDGHFVIGQHPDDTTGKVVIATGFHGEGQ